MRGLIYPALFDWYDVSVIPVVEAYLRLLRAGSFHRGSSSLFICLRIEYSVKIIKIQDLNDQFFKTSVNVK